MSKTFPPFEVSAQLIRFHHLAWKDGRGCECDHEVVPLGSHVIHLADRIAVLVDKQQDILNQVSAICDRIKLQNGKMFNPQLVEVFLSLAAKEYFWFDVTSTHLLGEIISQRAKSQLPTLNLDADGFIQLAKLFSHIIDFRSSITATHSSGVAAVSKALAHWIGFSAKECQLIEIAGYLHDLGKLAVPAEILEKPSHLTQTEYHIIKNHAYHTYRSLERIKGFDRIRIWAAFHHERLDGQGYPFHHAEADLPLGARIMAVADIFTAITEDRPYRAGMTEASALEVIQEMANQAAVDSKLVQMLRSNFDAINSIRIQAQKQASQEYTDFYAALRGLSTF